MDLQLHNLHSHPVADAALEVQTCVSRVVTVSSRQQRSSEVVAAHAEGFGTGRSCCRVFTNVPTASSTRAHQDQAEAARGTPACSL